MHCRLGSFARDPIWHSSRSPTLIASKSRWPAKFDVTWKKNSSSPNSHLANPNPRSSTKRSIFATKGRRTRLDRNCCVSVRAVREEDRLDFWRFNWLPDAQCMQKHLKHAYCAEARRHIISLHGGGVDSALTPASWMGQGGSASIHKAGRSCRKYHGRARPGEECVSSFWLDTSGRAMWPR